MLFFMTFLGLSALCYALGALILVTALGNVRRGTNIDQPPVTIVVAARNEASTIGNCLDALAAQDYPPGVDIIIVDDRSTDATAEIVRARALTMPRLHLITITATPEGVSPKKHALSLAIDQAITDIILQTDADCTPPPGWVATIVKRFEPGVLFVAGIAPYLPGRGLVNSFCRHEYLVNCLLSAGSIILGSPSHASGRNMAFRRSAFLDIGGYGESMGILSGDDTLLLHRMHRTFPHGIATQPDPAAQVTTTAPADFAAFIRQRIRHLSTGRFFNPLLIVWGMSVYGFGALTLLALALTPWSVSCASAFVVVFGLRCLVDAVAAHRASTVFAIPVQWRRFLLNEALLVAYQTVLPILGLCVPVRWKESRPNLT